MEEALNTCFEYLFLRKKVDFRQGFESKFREFIPDGYVFEHPYQLFWKITSACNLRCKHCFYRADEENYSSKNDLSYEKLIFLAHYFVDRVNITNVTVTGGEPFLQKAIFDILEVLAKGNLYINIITNATLINSEKAEILKRILNPKLTVFNVSIDGVSSDVHEKMRGKGSYDKALNGIKNLINAGFKVILNYTVTSLNVSEISNLYDCALNLGVKTIGLNRLEAEEVSELIPFLDTVFKQTAVLINRAEGDKNFSINNISLRGLDFLRYEYGRKLFAGMDFSLPADSSLRCHSHQRVEVNGDGNVYLCSAAELEELSLGNLRQDDFLEIWKKRNNNPLFQERLLTNSSCKGCNYSALCKAGCMAKAYKKYGTIDKFGRECLYE